MPFGSRPQNLSYFCSIFIQGRGYINSKGTGLLPEILRVSGVTRHHLPWTTRWALAPLMARAAKGSWWGGLLLILLGRTPFCPILFSTFVQIKRDLNAVLEWVLMESLLRKNGLPETEHFFLLSLHKQSPSKYHDLTCIIIFLFHWLYLKFSYTLRWDEIAVLNFFITVTLFQSHHIYSGSNVF